MARRKKVKITAKQGVSDYEGDLLQKIQDCNDVLSHLESCPAWKVITKDLQEQRKLIDDNWHREGDEKKVKEFRITKFAIMHLLEIRDKYEQDLKTAEEELRKYQNKENEITKDYDPE